MYRFELEQEPAVAQAAPAVIASPPLTAPAASPAERPCAPGRQCLLVYPKDAMDRAKKAADKALPEGPARPVGGGWEPSTSASPAQRAD
jgi:hypothetical protein